MLDISTPHAFCTSAREDFRSLRRKLLDSEDLVRDTVRGAGKSREERRQQSQEEEEEEEPLQTWAARVSSGLQRSVLHGQDDIMLLVLLLLHRWS